MPAPPLLVTQHRTGSVIQVFRMTGGTTLAEQIGPNIGVISGEGGHNNNSAFNAMNYAIEFKGKIYVCGNASSSVFRIFRFDPPSTWTLVFSGSTSGQSGVKHSGLHVVTLDGVQHLCAVFDSGSNTHSVIKSSDGSTWTSTVAITAANFYYGHNIVFRNKLYLFWNPGTIAVADIGSGTISLVGVPSGWAGDTAGGRFCVFRNRLFLARYKNQTTGCQVYEFTGGGFVQRSSAPGTGSSAQFQYSSPVLFPVGDTKMVMIYTSADTNGQRAVDIIPNSGTTFTTTEVTNPLVPIGLRNNGLYMSRWDAFVDNDTDPANPRVYLWYLTANIGGSRSYYEYVDSSTELLAGSPAPDANHAMTSVPTGGGDRINTSASMDITVTNVTPIFGGLRITYTAFNAAGAADKFVRLWHSPYEGPDLAQGTLFGSATGGTSVRVGNEIQQVEADGTTVYTLDWNAEADGYTSGSPAAWVLRISTT